MRVAQLLLLLALAPIAAEEVGESDDGGGGLEPTATVGGDSDEHGCVSAAGYSWCAALDECVREWETACPEECTAGLYRETASGNCTALTVCNQTEIETRAPTATSDRECRCRGWAAWTVGDMAWRVAAIIFLFCGIAVICADYFTPSLEGITNAWQLSEDVAGATFMAAGSAAPELFTSLIAVFAPEKACGADTDSVGVGTIVGSAVFNVLVIIGLSAVLGCRPGKALDLDWKPLLRDTAFYVLAIVLLAVFLYDGEVWWQEALVMFLVYVSYITFMRFNERVCYPNGRPAKHDQLAADDDVDDSDSADATAASAPQEEQAAAAAAAAAVEDAADAQQDDAERGEGADADGGEETKELVATEEEEEEEEEDETAANAHWGHSLGWVPHERQLCNLEYPESCAGKLFFVIMLPWTLAFKYTVPDCSQNGWEEWYMLGFLGSIVWIALICYFMVEWSVDVAEMVQMTPTIMAFTVLAAGTSIPDAMESVIVARKGMADMAVSNALGSNIFDILFGLSVPYFLVNMQNLQLGDHPPVVMCVKDLTVYLAVLLSTLAFTIAALCVMGWKLGRKLGWSLLVLYCAVVVGAILRDYDVIAIGEKC